MRSANASRDLPGHAVRRAYPQRNGGQTCIGRLSPCAAPPLRNIFHRDGLRVVAMSGSDSGYDCDRYRRLLAEANDEPKRLALIKLLIDEKAKDRLARHRLHTRLSSMEVSKAVPR